MDFMIFGDMLYMYRRCFPAYIWTKLPSQVAPTPHVRLLLWGREDGHMKWELWALARHGDTSY